VKAIVAACALVVLPGCLEIERVVIDLDLVHHTATLRFFNIGASDPRLAASLDAALVPEADDAVRGGQFAAFGIEWVTLAQAPRIIERTTAGKTTLYGAVDLAWKHLYEVGLSSANGPHPLRYCLGSTGALSIAASNAIARDGHGCVLWDASATSLHIEVVQTAPRHDPQPFVRAWRAMHP
jgi:hypothetical protein